MFIVASGEFLSGLDSKSAVFSEGFSVQELQHKERISILPWVRMRSCCCFPLLLVVLKVVKVKVLQCKEMAIPKGKAAKQTGQKVPPLLRLFRACESLTSSSLPRGLMAVEMPSGHPGWMEQKSLFSFGLFLYHRPLRDVLVAAQCLHPLLTGARLSSDALGPVMLWNRRYSGTSDALGPMML